jgi:secreted PhoX family phosphatase
VTDEFTVLFASPGADVLNAPENMCVSPRGGLVLCEDGGGMEFVHGLTTEGEIFRFAANVADLRGGTAGKNVPPSDYRGSEWAGAVFEPRNGSWLFVNLQSPGITLAITGPWRKGAL